MKRLPNGIELEPGEVAELVRAARASVPDGVPAHPRDLYLAAVADALEELVGGPWGAPPAFVIGPAPGPATIRRLALVRQGHRGAPSPAAEGDRAALRAQRGERRAAPGEVG